MFARTWYWRLRLRFARTQQALCRALDGLAATGETGRDVIWKWLSEPQDWERQLWGWEVAIRSLVNARDSRVVSRLVEELASSDAEALARQRLRDLEIVDNRWRDTPAVDAAIAKLVVQLISPPSIDSKPVTIGRLERLDPLWRTRQLVKELVIGLVDRLTNSSTDDYYPISHQLGQLDPQWHESAQGQASLLNVVRQHKWNASFSAAECLTNTPDAIAELVGLLLDRDLSAQHPFDSRDWRGVRRKLDTLDGGWMTGDTAQSLLAGLHRDALEKRDSKAAGCLLQAECVDTGLAFDFWPSSLVRSLARPDLGDCLLREGAHPLAAYLEASVRLLTAHLASGSQVLVAKTVLPDDLRYATTTVSGYSRGVGSSEEYVYETSRTESVIDLRPLRAALAQAVPFPQVTARHGEEPQV